MSSDAAAFLASTQLRPTLIWPLGVLRDLVVGWFAGFTVTRIAQQLDRSRNSIVGKVHMLGLPRRPSPIVRPWVEPPPRSERPPRVPHRARVTLPAPAPPPPVVTSEPPVALPEPPAFAPNVVPFVRSHRACCWPDGHRPNLRWCEATALLGKPYCAEHHQRAYQKGSANAGR